MKEAYVESLHDILANYRIDNPDNVDDTRKYFKESVHPQKKFVVGQRRENGGRRHGGGIIPVMM